MNASSCSAINRRASSSSQQDTAATPTSGSTSYALHAIKLHEERTARRIQQLDAFISDSTLGIVPRTKAKVELALLKNDHEDHRQSREEEIATIAESSGVSKHKRMVEQTVKSNEVRLANELAIQNHLANLHTIALERQREDYKIDLV